MSRVSPLRNQVQLITYPDSLGGTLAEVSKFVDSYLSEVIGGVHLLPFYPSSADRGFSPLTHLEVDPAFGSWDDIAKIAEDYDLVVDLMVNHVSSESEYFQDYLSKGESSAYREIFLTMEELHQRYNVGSDAFAETYRPRPTLPFSTFEFADGTTRDLWTTFTNHQIDLDTESPKARMVLCKFIDALVQHGATLIRLDAVGYTIKRPWTNSFMLPETHEFLRWIRSVTPSYVDILAEIHADPASQIDLLDSDGVDWVYDFSLPMLTLHALLSGSTSNLKHWINIRPKKQITTLDTHDGIGVIDVEGLMTPKEIAETSAWVQSNGANQNLRASGHDADNLDVYQLNSTYYSALGASDDAYITARAIQFFVPGIPQVYYVGLLAGVNDYETLAETGHGRDINRHNYHWSEIITAMDQAVVQRLLRLMYLRSNHPAFDGEFTMLPSDDGILVLQWENAGEYCQAHIDLEEKSVFVEQTDTQTGQIIVVRY